MTPDEGKKIIDTITVLLTHLGIENGGITKEELGGSTFFTIKTRDSARIIGTHGDSLNAFNHIVKKMLERELPHDTHYVIDVNGYQAKHIHDLVHEAKLVAERARTFRYDIELAPMSAYDRMIVHSTLKEIPNIETSSQGEGALRHIVVRYHDPAAPTTATEPV